MAPKSGAPLQVLLRFFVNEVLKSGIHPGRKNEFYSHKAKGVDFVLGQPVISGHPVILFEVILPSTNIALSLHTICPLFVDVRL